MGKLALSELVQHTQSHLRPERITMATSEDVPEVLTPLVESLSHVMQKSGKVKHQLKGITDAADEVLGKSDISSGHRANAHNTDDDASAARKSAYVGRSMVMEIHPLLLMLPPIHEIRSSVRTPPACC